MEIKDKVHEIIDSLPIDVLQEVLHYLQEVAKSSKEKIETTHYLRNIIQEDAELLKRLAQ